MNLSGGLNPRIFEELKGALEKGLASGALLTADQVAQQTKTFQDRFGTAVLKATDGEGLLRLMHGRADSSARCLMYWLEFKDDSEFAGNRFGGIGGGTAMKFGVYQRQSDAEWMSGDPTNPQVIPIVKAISIAQQQRAELLAGCEVLDSMAPDDTGDAAYERLQAAMSERAPALASTTWAHKYWFMYRPDRIDDYHSPRYQRFHLLKLLQMPPDHAGIRDGGLPRFLCAGRFIGPARALGVPVNTLNTALNQRDGAFHRYWRVGTTEGNSGESHWPTMRNEGFVSIGWGQVPDLSSVIGTEGVKEQVRRWLLPLYASSENVAGRKAGEIMNFAVGMAENDMVLACEGETVLGVGRIRGPYEHDSTLGFPHKRRVEWVLVDSWRLPEPEGRLTTVFELGRKATNILEIETRLFERQSSPPRSNALHETAAAVTIPSALPPLEPFAARLDLILARKGQLILYGPPGTGKTYRALEVSRELAARRTLGKPYASTSPAERSRLEAPDGFIRICTFHPGYGYEDFIEGLRPRILNDHMVFEPGDGIFKKLCNAARDMPDKHFYLIIDEINRGDVPRIFGELLTVIERDKRMLSVTLSVSGRPFNIPGNLYVIGTMNTADRSISLLDAALRRRFGFVEMMPDSNQIRNVYAGPLPLGLWLDALNHRIRKVLRRDARNLQIGHAYLMTRPPITSVADFARVLREDIIPLLEEYCYDDFAALGEILGHSLINSSQGSVREELFEPNREGDLIEACNFEEIQSLVVTQGLTEAVIAQDEAEPSTDDDDAGPRTPPPS